MAPTRRSNRQSRNNFTMSAVDLEQQIEEMRRYEQERLDRQMAEDLQRELYQQPQTDNPPPNPRQAVQPPEIPPPPRSLEVSPTVTVNGRNSRRTPRPSPLATSTPNQTNSTTSPPSPILASAPRVYLPNTPLRPTRISQEIPQNRVPIRYSDRTGRTAVTVRSGASRRQGVIIRSSHGSSIRISRLVTDDSDDSDSSGEVQIVARPNSRVSSDSSTSSNSSRNASSNRLVPAEEYSQRTFLIPPYSRSNLPLNAGDQPSSSHIIPIERIGTPDPTWGDCTMCFEVPIQPQGCNRCFQIIGCKTCVDGWFNTAGAPSCPLCRQQWIRKPDVAKMSVVDNNRRRKTLRARRSTIRNQAVSLMD